MLQCVHADQVLCGLHNAHACIICSVRDDTHVRKCTRPSSALPYCKRWEAGRGPGNEATLGLHAKTAVRRKATRRDGAFEESLPSSE